MAEATVEEIAGFVNANVKRRQVLDLLDKNDNRTFEEIRKITRTPNVILEKVLKDMVEKGAVALRDDRYIMTENGKTAANIVFRQSNKSKVHKYDSNIQRDI